MTRGYTEEQQAIRHLEERHPSATENDTESALAEKEHLPDAQSGYRVKFYGNMIRRTQD